MLPYYESQLLASFGALLADCDEEADAARALDEGEALAQAHRMEGALLAIRLHRGHLELCRARAEAARGDMDAAARNRARARERLKAPASTPEALFAKRMLDRAIAAAEVSAVEPVGALVVAPDARECRVPDGRVLDLSKRPRLRRLLLALVEARSTDPGRAMSVDELFATAWRGESARYESMRSRVYVAVRQLRDLGLREWLLHDLDGYLLDPAVRVERSAI